MKRTAAVVVAALLVLGTLGGLPLSSLAQTESSDSGEAVEPGEQFAGVVNVGQAELEGEMEERTFEVRFSRANSSAGKAAVLASQVNQSQERLAELEEERDRLQAARANGSISEGEYRARMARLVAEMRTVERMATRTESAARSLPNETLRERGINVTAIRTLRTDARNMTGPEVAAVARTIAGPGVGRADPGRPAQATNESERGPPQDGTTARGDSASNASNSGNASSSGNGSNAPTNESGRSGARTNGDDSPQRGGGSDQAGEADERGGKSGGTDGS